MDFTCKACYIAGRHLTDPPDNVPTYASVVYCESVRILFLISNLYDINVLAAYISNSLLNTQHAKKVFLKSGTKFKSCEGMSVNLVPALCGLKIAGVSFRAHLVNTL